MTLEDIRSRIETVEKAYEFFLAFAAQGVRADSQNKLSGQLRDFLGGMAEALTELPDGVRAHIEAGGVAPEALAFNEVLARDAASALAAVDMVRAQPAIGSQLIDNFNASIHVRALLTDLFLLDEVLARPEPDATE